MLAQDVRVQLAHLLKTASVSNQVGPNERDEAALLLWRRSAHVKQHGRL